MTNAHAVVGRISAILPHPNPEVERLEVIHVNKCPGSFTDSAWAAMSRCTCTDQDHAVVQLVTGKHYRVGDLGIWLRPGAWIPGWLAYQLWMVGKKRATEPFEVREIEIMGKASPGLWCGQWYRNDSSKESQLRADDLERGGGIVVDGWIKWAHWQDRWQPGDQVDDELGVESPDARAQQERISGQ